MLKLLMIQGIGKGTQREMQEKIRKVRLPWLSQDRVSHPVPQVFLIIFEMMLIPQSSPLTLTTCCNLLYSSLPGEENKPKPPENTSSGTENNKTTINVSSKESCVTLPTLKTQNHRINQVEKDLWDHQVQAIPQHRLTPPQTRAEEHNLTAEASACTYRAKLCCCAFHPSKNPQQLLLSA